MTQPITPEYILDLFENSPTVIIKEQVKTEQSDKTKKRPRSEDYPVLRPRSEINYSENQPDSPHTMRILEHAKATPTSEGNLRKLISGDTAKIIEIETKQEKHDDLYKQYYDSELGVFIEKWVCSRMKCPGCKTGRLLKYANSSFPVIDVKCEGTNHNIQQHGPLYFQIKATNGFAKSGPYPYYFDMKSEKPYIKIGSKKFGEFSHSVKVDSPLDRKKLLIGYICINYKTTNSESGSLRLSINFGKSFILIPDLSKNGVSENYYTYIDGEPSTITFNVKQFLKATTFADLNLQTLFQPIDTNINFSETDYLPESEAGKRLRMMQKYLKYKMKYLQLKKLIENNYN